MPNSSNCDDDNVVELLDWSCFDELNDNELSSNMVGEDSLLTDENFSNEMIFPILLVLMLLK